MQLDRKKLTPDLSEDAGWEAWEEYLMETDQAELVQLLLTRMAADPGFMRFMYLRYAQTPQKEDETGNRIRAFREAVLEEMMGSDPEAEYLVSLSERCFGLCGKGEEPRSAVRLLLGVVLTLDEVLSTGRFKGEDSLLLADCIRDAVKMIQRKAAGEKLIQEAAGVCRLERTRKLLAETLQK